MGGVASVVGDPEQKSIRGYIINAIGESPWNEGEARKLGLATAGFWLTLKVGMKAARSDRSTRGLVGGVLIP